MEETNGTHPTDPPESATRQPTSTSGRSASSASVWSIVTRHLAGAAVRPVQLLPGREDEPHGARQINVDQAASAEPQLQTDADRRTSRPPRDRGRQGPEQLRLGGSAEGHRAHSDRSRHRRAGQTRPAVAAQTAAAAAACVQRERAEAASGCRRREHAELPPERSSE